VPPECWYLSTELHRQYHTPDHNGDNINIFSVWVILQHCQYLVSAASSGSMIHELKGIWKEMLGLTVMLYWNLPAGTEEN
jgi:hypothetical protein